MSLAFVEFEWDITPEVAFTQLTEAYIEAIRRGVRQIAAHYAPLIEEWMKANAPWQDRTGDARRLLNVEAEDLALDMVQISLNHGVEYAMYLETMFAGAYSVLGPALDVFAPQVWADVQALLR